MAPMKTIPTQNTVTASSLPVEVVTVLGEGGQPLQAIVGGSSMAPIQSQAGMQLPTIPVQTVLDEDGDAIQVVTIVGADGQSVQAILAAPGTPVQTGPNTPLAMVPSQTVTLDDGSQAQALTIMGEDGQPGLAIVSTASAVPSGALMASQHWGPVSSMAALPTGSMALPLPVTSIPAETLSDPAGNPLEVITIINQEGAPMQALLSQPGLPPPSADLGLPIVPTQSVILHEGGVPVQVVTVLGENDTPVQAVVTKDGAPLQAPVASMAQLPTGAQSLAPQPSYHQPTGSPVRTIVQQGYPGTVTSVISQPSVPVQQHPYRPGFITEPIATHQPQVPQFAPQTQQFQPQYPVTTAPPQYVTAPVMTQGQPVASMGGRPVTTMPGAPQIRYGPPTTVSYGQPTTAQMPPQEPSAMGYSMPVASSTSVPTQQGQTQYVGAPIVTTGAPQYYQPGQTVYSMPQQTAAAAASAPGEPIMMGPGAVPFRGSLLKAGSITDDVFNMIDRDHDGVISRSEFRGALKGNIISATDNTRAALGR